MATKELVLAANTWTDLTSFIASVGQHLIVTMALSDVKLGRKGNGTY